MTTPAWASGRRLPSVETLQYTRAAGGAVLVCLVALYVLARMVKTGKPVRTAQRALRHVAKV